MRDEGRAEGKAEGIAESIIDLLEDVGTVSAKLQERIYLQKDTEILRNWHKVAARVQSIEEFEDQISTGI